MVFIQINGPTTFYVQSDKKKKQPKSNLFPISNSIFFFVLFFSLFWNWIRNGIFKVNKVTCSVLNHLFWLLLKWLSDVDDIPINSKHLMIILNTGACFVCAHFIHQTKIILSPIKSTTISTIQSDCGLLNFDGRDENEYSIFSRFMIDSSISKLDGCFRSEWKQNDLYSMTRCTVISHQSSQITTVKS